MHPKYFISWLFFLMLTANVMLFAREAPYIQFENFTYKEGLPDNTVFQIAKDTSGFVWIATAGGVVRYDGATFKTMYHKEDNQNLPLSNQIKALMVDSENYLWIGTQKDGVSRYDIINDTYLHFNQIEKIDRALTSLQILNFMEDSQGRIWIGTESGVNVWDKSTKQMTQFIHNPTDTTSLGAHAVLCTMEDSAGRIWLGTWAGGLNLLIPDKTDFSQSTFKKFTHNSIRKETISENNVWSLYEDSKKRIWVGTFGGGLNLMIPGLVHIEDERSFTAQFIHYKHTINSPSTLTSNDIYSITGDDENYLWVGTGGGLSILDLNDVGPLSHIDVHIAQTIPEVHFTNYSNLASGASITGAIVRNIYIDNTNSYWLSTIGGVSKYDKKGIKFTSALTTDEVDEKYQIEAITIENLDKYWLAVGNAGILEYQKDTKTYTIHRGKRSNGTAIDNDNFVSIMQHSDGNLWIGNDSGFAIFDTKQKIFKNFPLGESSSIQANCILEDSKGRIWVATNEGLYRILEATEDSLKYLIYLHDDLDPLNTLSHNNISSIAEDNKGNIWATTWYGLNKITVNEDDELRFKKYFHDSENSTSIGNDREMVCLKIHNGKVWIANGIGISRYRPETDDFINYDSSNGLPSVGIVAMEIDNAGDVWCSTRQGVFTFFPKTQKFKYFYKEDGLQSNYFSLRCSYKDKKGTIYFGGKGGYTIIVPEDIVYNSTPPKTLITGFEVFNEERHFDEPIEYMKTIKLDYSENYFTIKFSALNYIQPDRNEYTYKLEGFDDDWRDCGSQNFASYTNLSGGEYIFRVKGSNNDGFWSKKGASIKIIVTPPFWRTWWFWITLVSSVALITYLYNKQRTDAIRRRSHELEVFNAKLSSEIEVREETEQRLREREQKLKEAEKQLEETISELKRSNKELEQFAYIASHDLQEPLRMVGSFVQLIDRRYADKLDDAGREYIAFTVDGVNRMSDLIKGLLSFSRLGRQNANFEWYDLNTIVEKKMLDTQKYITERNATVKIDRLPEAVFCDTTQIGAIFYNLIANAIKFNRRDNPTVHVKLEEDNVKHWLFSVKDNGIGIKPEYKETVFGIFKRLNTSDEFKGSGIGLALCKRIVDNHEGEIWFESEKETGTTFFFTISKYLNTEDEVNSYEKKAALVE